MNPDKSHGAVDVNSIERFQFVIPGYVWQGINPGETLEFQISAGEQILHTQSLQLNAELLQHWLANIKKYNNQYFTFLALEHLRYFPSFDLLSCEIKSYFAALASEHNLPTIAFARSVLPASSKDLMKQASDGRNINAALKSFNMSLNLQPDDILSELKYHIEKFNLDHVNRVQFLVFLIPYLCRENLFPQLLATMDTRGVKESLLKQWNNTNLSILLVFYAAEEKPRELSKALYTISENSANGDWLHTECIHFACSHSFALMDRGLIKEEDHTEVCYAFLALLKSFNQETFSRLHDHLLIDALVQYLHKIDDAPPWLQRDLVAAAIEHHGLNPYFWKLVESSMDSSVWFDCDVAEAYRCWQAIQKELNTEDIKLSNVSAPLAFFAGHNNHEAHHFMRVACIHELGKLDSDAMAINATTNQLAQQNPLERLRISANPSACNFTFPHNEPSKQIWEHIRREAGDANVSYYVQKQAAHCLEKITLACDADDMNSIERECIKLINFSQRISKPRHNYIGIHLCVFAIARLLPKTYDASHLLDFVIDGLIHAADHTHAGGIMPPPLQSALVMIGQSHLVEHRTLQRLSAKLTDTCEIINSSTIRQDLKLPLAAETSSFHSDTIVVIYSCQKYLDSRVQAIRDTWLRDIKARGIPYVILVGDGDDRLQGDILRLKVSDTYEELPQKSLKLYEWIYTHTNAQYVLKIDDDCFLNVAEYFDSLSYRKHHYYGRPLERSHITMNRTWHQGKSHSKHAQLSIDKSPTPSIYADGGSSYSLSRYAVSQLSKKSQSAEGCYLIQSSYMEDKLVGDLLSLSNIHPSGEDLSVYIRRRTFPNAAPVGMMANSLYPSKVTPMKLVHLDTDKDMKTAYEQQCRDDYWPKKIWPTTQAPSLLEAANQLELLTPVDQNAKLLKGQLFVVSVLRNEMTMLPHFLDHYRSMGVKTFIIVDNLSDDGSREYILEQPDVILYSADTDYNKSHYGVLWQQAVLSNHCLNKWALIADMDEFLVYPDMENKDLSTYLYQIDMDSFDCVRTDMVDMYPRGDLANADFDKTPPFQCAQHYDLQSIIPCNYSKGMYSNKTSTVSGLRHRLDITAKPNAYTSQKYALIKYKPWMKFSEGLHDATGIEPSPNCIHFAHFKYHAGFKEKALIEIKREQHYGKAIEYKQYVSLLAETEGNFFVPSTSMKYDFSSSFHQSSQ